MTKLAGFLSPLGQQAYFFTGNLYVRYDVAGDCVEADYPKQIAENWTGLFDRDIDAVLIWPGEQYAYFFRGDEYIKYDVSADCAVEDYPRSIEENWPGLFAHSIDGAVAWPNGYLYFFRGDEYIKYDPVGDCAVDGYPRPIADAWRGLPIAPADFSDPAPATSIDERPIPVESPGGGRIRDKSEPAPADLATAEGISGNGVQLHRLAATFWTKLMEAARSDGIEEPLLRPVSGYRSVEQQKRLWEEAVRKHGSEDKARVFVAPQGSSPHHSGRAVDCWLGSSTDSENVAKQRKTPAYAWLVLNAERFGFYPYDKEPWHWEYNPPQS